MNSTTEEGESGGQAGFVVELGSLGSYLAQLPDRRCARGKRYALWQACVLAVLAKLRGEDHAYGMAQWVQKRAAKLGPLLGLGLRMPCHNTYRRVLGQWVCTTELEAQVKAFLLAQSAQGGKSVLIAFDGKTLRGTIPTGDSHGVHLLAAYVPDSGVVLVQGGDGQQGKRDRSCTARAGTT